MRGSLLMVFALGCGTGRSGDRGASWPADPSSGRGDVPRVRMDFRREGAFLDAPFPSDDLRRDGVIDVAGYPNPDAMPYVESVRSILSDADGFGTTMGIFFALTEEIPPISLAPWDTVEADSPVYLVPIDHPDARVPVEVRFTEDGGPFGAPNLLSLLPLQGVPLRSRATYVAVVTTDLGLAPSPELAAIAAGEPVEGVEPTLYAAAIDALGRPVDQLAGLAVFTTWDPVGALHLAVDAARAYAPVPRGPLVLTEVHDAFCVYESAVEMPVYQEGEPPYDAAGGWQFEGGAPVLQDLALSRLWVTVPRAAAPAAGWPVAVMVRTGGGGDRPMIDRGIRDAEGQVALSGTGPAMHFAEAGFAGVMVDGPHGGPRNVTGADEQFLMFNVTNPVATRDNVRQSALELALLPDLVADLSFDVAGCPGAKGPFVADSDHIAIFGHSMGATIAPLVLDAEPRFGAAILSGAGGSYIHNIVYKQSPLTVRPIAEAMLNYPAYGRTLDPHDPFLSMLQWAAEPADPPVYAPGVDAHVILVQGIVDTYILPPMANAASLSLGLDLGGLPLDADHPDLQDMVPLAALLPLVGRGRVDLPATDPTRTAIVVQRAEDGVEDGHEVIFQTREAMHQYGCFLRTWASGAPVVPAPDGPCP